MIVVVIQTGMMCGKADLGEQLPPRCAVEAGRFLKFLWNGQQCRVDDEHVEAR